MNKTMTLAASISVALISLTGCGASSDSSDSQTGYFIDSQVHGLNYKTSSGKEGKTNSLGQFFYNTGDTVSFSLGNLQLGQAAPQADGLITPKHISKSVSNNQEEADELEVLLLRFLQSLDVDQNPENGITINPRLVDSLSKINQTSISENTETSILDIDTDLKNELDKDGDGAMDVDETTALAHADQSLSNWNNGVKPTNGNGNGNGNGNNQDNNQDNGQGDTNPPQEPTGASNLTDDQKYSLAYMWNEERLAKDIYLALNDLYPIKQFENIATKSEVKHISAVEDLVEKYDINILNLVDYTVNYSEEELRALPPGTYAVESVQKLYDDLYAKGEKSKVDALQAACMVEVVDVDDLDKFIKVAEEVNADDLVSVYENLRQGSYNHYWVFDQALKTEGVEAGCASLGAEYAKTEEEYPSNK